MTSHYQTSDRSSVERSPLAGAQSAQRTVDLLVLIARSAEGRTPGELAQSLGVSRQLVYHLLQTLKPARWVTVDKAGRWHLGPACAVIENGLRMQAVPAKSAGSSSKLPPPPGAWLTIAAENRMALLSSVRGRAALAALEELSSYWGFLNG